MSLDGGNGKGAGQTEKYNSIEDVATNNNTPEERDREDNPYRNHPQEMFEGESNTRIDKNFVDKHFSLFFRESDLMQYNDGEFDVSIYGGEGPNGEKMITIYKKKENYESKYRLIKKDEEYYLVTEKNDPDTYYNQYKETNEPHATYTPEKMTTKLNTPKEINNVLQNFEKREAEYKKLKRNERQEKINEQNKLAELEEKELIQEELANLENEIKLA